MGKQGWGAEYEFGEHRANLWVMTQIGEVKNLSLMDKTKIIKCNALFFGTLYLFSILYI